MSSHLHNKNHGQDRDHTPLLTLWWAKQETAGYPRPIVVTETHRKYIRLPLTRLLYSKSESPPPSSPTSLSTNTYWHISVSKLGRSRQPVRFWIRTRGGGWQWRISMMFQADIERASESEREIYGRYSVVTDVRHHVDGALSVEWRDGGKTTSLPDSSSPIMRPPLESFGERVLILTSLGQTAACFTHNS